jgi:DNA polymerase III alpha subunit
MSDKFKNMAIVGPHNHPFSLDSGNSVKQFIRSAAKDFGRTAIGITDHGTIGAIIEAHEYAKDLKKKENLDIKIIPGVELYLVPAADDDCGAAYYHVTVHFEDFAAYL